MVFSCCGVKLVPVYSTLLVLVVFFSPEPLFCFLPKLVKLGMHIEVLREK